VLAGGNLDFGTAEGVIITSRREHAITSQISGQNGITIAGDGQLTINNSANNFTGEIRVNNGGSPLTGAIGVFVQNDGSLGNADNPVHRRIELPL
jgi:autotransporter-associated beta strand protein